MKFIGYFLKDHLDEDLQNHLPKELYQEAKELIFEYDELIGRAESAMELALSRFSPKERSMIDVGTCSECGNRTVLIGADDEPTCYFCDKTVFISQCQYCGEYLPPDELIGAGICRNCYEYRISKD